jgi:hypothetical protein
VQERVLDPGQQRRQALASRDRGRVVPHISGSHRRHPGQLGPGLRIQRASPGQHLLHPGPRLALEVQRRPEQPQDPEQVRQRPAVMGQVPAHGGGQVSCLTLEPVHPFASAGAAQPPVRLLGQRPVVAGVPAADLGGVGPEGEMLRHELADGFQHPRPGPEPGAVEVDQAVPGQLLRQLQRPVLIQARHSGGGLDGPAVGEHRRDLEQ